MARTTRAAPRSRALLLVLLLVATVAALARPALGRPTRMAKRTVSAADLANFRGAILVKNGQTTSCEVALIDNKAALVAANCLDYSGGSLTAGVTYEVYFDGAKGAAPAKVGVAVSDITVHPKFSMDTFANNIAILQFSFTAQGSWVNYIAAYRDEWSDTVYVRRTLASPAAMQWQTPSVQSGRQDEPGCTSASMLYDRNQQTLFCSRGYTPSAFKTTCNMPYGSVYGVASSSMAIAALYSHTVAYGGNACGGGQEYHYYTVLTNYLKYVRSVLGRTPMEFVEDTDGLSSVRRIISYYMGSSTAPNADGTTMFGGNMVALQGGVQQVPQQDAGQPSPGQSSTVGVGNAIQTSQPYNSTSGVGPTPTPTPTSPSPSLQRPPANHNNGAVGDPADSNNSYDNSAANGDLQNTGIATRPHVSVDFEATGTDALSGEPAHYSGLSQKATIAIAVSVPIGTILIAAIVFFLVRHYRRNKAAGWRGGSGSGKRKSNVHSIIEQLGGAAREERLPTYEDLHDADMRDLNLPSPRTLPDY